MAGLQRPGNWSSPMCRIGYMHVPRRRVLFSGLRGRLLVAVRHVSSWCCQGVKGVKVIFH
jgi:hypothetical protein